MKFLLPEFTEEFVAGKIREYKSSAEPFASEKDLNKFILNCIDHTTLEGTDNTARINSLCQEALDICNITSDKSTVASVCVYPVFAEVARRKLQNSGIGIACVAGAFPSGQSPVHVRVAEAAHAVKMGATEIDMVISRGKMLEGDYSFVYHEVHEIKKAIGNAHLKVILETGELQNLNLIARASEIAIQAGADFIKTSTGKMKPAATPEAFFVMLEAIKAYQKEKGKKIGIKPAGGISTAEDANDYVKILYGHLGSEWLNNKLFRIGASRLTRKMTELLA